MIKQLDANHLWISILCVNQHSSSKSLAICPILYGMDNVVLCAKCCASSQRRDNLHQWHHSFVQFHKSLDTNDLRSRRTQISRFGHMTIINDHIMISTRVNPTQIEHEFREKKTCSSAIYLRGNRTNETYENRPAGRSSTEFSQNDVERILRLTDELIFCSQHTSMNDRERWQEMHAIGLSFIDRISINYNWDVCTVEMCPHTVSFHEHVKRVRMCY